MATTRYAREADGAWEILEDGARRGSRTDTKKKALAQARAIVRREGGGEVRVVNKAGKVAVASKVGRRRRVRAA